MFLGRRAIRLQLSIAAIFVLLILPALGFVIAFSYYENARNLRSLSNRFIDRARDETITMVLNFLEPVGATLKLVAAMAEPGPSSSAARIAATSSTRRWCRPSRSTRCMVSFEDGYHRVVTRIDADRRRSDPRIPGRANWHSSWIDPFGVEPRRRHRTFFETWPQPLGGYDVDTDLDVRTIAQYRMAKLNNELGITEPMINPDTGYPIISLGYPIRVDSRFVGVASANITLTAMSRFLDTHKVSPNSITVIAHRLGDVIAHPVEAEGCATTADRSG
jgi:adenylate cyclase